MIEPQHWLRWWANCWETAHVTWWPPVLYQLPKAHLMAMARGHHQAIASAFGVSPAVPCEPDPALAGLIVAPDARFQYVLSIARAMCAPRGDFDLDPADHQWAIRVARALRPGQWLGDLDNVNVLLRQWVDAAQWQRLRLRFVRNEIDALEAKASTSATTKQIATFWYAAIWRAGIEYQ